MFPAYYQNMRKYLIIFIFILFTVPCVWGQTIKRTTKLPTFFVPNDTFKNKNRMFYGSYHRK